MNKTELMKNYTIEQLAEMVIRQEEENRKLYGEAKKWQKEAEQHRKVYQSVCHLEDLESESVWLKSEIEKYQNASEVKNDEIQKLKCRISNLEEDNGRFQSKLDTYNNYLLPKATKEAKELIDQNHFTGVRIVTWEQWNNREEKTVSASDIQKCQEEYKKLLKESPLEGVMNKISKDILEQKNNAMAMEFTRIICDLLKKYGVHVHCTQTKFSEKITTNSIEEEYGIVFDSMDFSQHDKEFTDKIEELQSETEKDKTELERAKNTINQIDDILEKLFGVRHDVGKPDEFEKILSDKAKYNVANFLPTEPIKVADILINASKKRTNCMTGKEYDKYIFEKWQLRQIAEHLLVYCNHNGELEE